MPNPCPRQQTMEFGYDYLCMAWGEMSTKMTIWCNCYFGRSYPHSGHCCENNICWLEDAKTVFSALLATNRSLAFASLPITFGSQARLGDCNCICWNWFEVAATKQCISITVTLLRSEAEQQWERSDQVVHWSELQGTTRNCISCPVREIGAVLPAWDKDCARHVRMEPTYAVFDYTTFVQSKPRLAVGFYVCLLESSVAWSGTNQTNTGAIRLSLTQQSLTYYFFFWRFLLMPLRKILGLSRSCSRWLANWLYTFI